MKISLLPKFALLGIVFALTGCATNGDPRDPLEPLNRGVYKFNDTIDEAVLKPVAKGYKAVLPNPVRTSVGNFFSNIDDALIAVNNLLQFKFSQAASDVARLIANTTFGIGGLFDVATSFGLEKHNEDFGQTLGYWGVGDGPFLMLPILGPSNLRDTVGLAAYYQLDPVWNLSHIPTRNTLGALRVIDRRARLLDAEKVLDEAALDPYTFLRDAYIQQRRNLIYDGNPPREQLEDEPAPAKQAEAAEGSLHSSGAPTGVPLAGTEEVKSQTVSEAPVVESGEKLAIETEKRLEAAAPAAPTVENQAENPAKTETQADEMPMLLAWLFRGGDAAGWQE
ncbi:MAG: VacJ family lipoprotein [Burkholderiales bacterium]|nr:VacJ family lipoprotein [Burkholderiales bacterium]